MNAIRIGTRGSALALWQANWVRDRLLELAPGASVELVIIKTLGDQILDRPLADVGGKGLFVKEIEQALLDGTVDLAVHSLKDMPTAQPDGLALVAFPPRAAVLDAFCPADAGATLASLPQGARVGTSSLRRSAQIARLRPDIEIVSIRGNVGTRLGRRRNHGGDLDGVILAEAGLRRLGLWDESFVPLGPPDILPAPAQGALAIETRTEASAVRELVAKLDDFETRLAVVAERACLAAIGGDCRTPFAAYAWRDEVDGLVLHARLLEPSGHSTTARRMVILREDPLAQALELGTTMARNLIERHQSSLPRS